ncbi:ribosome hibernation-promoting factor, HPF/YfiA family [Rubellicoccus peritrichatus]|uniref:Ribosome hibernation promoting factor n=1 Tax=Rubellicoccus peritrichatus TaxID=3080537 RepID=A0AAQ3LE51_9BACT|nr:ribosome-associated translation inhibitor RaiA [Puniceicoccus sp. CR14]WOO42834.1 ribosome-associated translation inhibitor RaiA [Puniceicoccus sp. CR14]
MNNHEIIISGVHMDLTDSIKYMVESKAEKLFQHEERIIRVRMELEAMVNKGNGKQEEFIAKGHIEINGPPMVVSSASNDLYKSIDQTVQKLDRKLRRRSRLKRVKRKDTHPIELPADLPKVEEVA